MIVAIAGAFHGNHSIAIDADGTIWAWGSNTLGQLGLGHSSQQLTPAAVKASPNNPFFATVAAGQGHTLALTQDGTMWAWGDNRNGQLGLGHTTMRLAPVEATAGPGDEPLPAFVSLAAGGSGGVYFSMGVGQDGSVWAWGNNGSGQLGLGSGVTQVRYPTWVAALDGVPIAAIAGGSWFTVALTGRLEPPLEVEGFLSPLRSVLVPSDMVALSPDVQVNARRRAIPLKLRVFDPDGTELTDVDFAERALDTPAVVSIVARGPVDPSPHADVIAVEGVAAAMDGTAFRYEDGAWIFVLDRGQLTAGAYIVTVDVGGTSWHAEIVLR